MNGETCRVETRQRLRQWLEGQINSGLVPKLEWLDRMQAIFKVPWKHAGKPGFVLDRDAVLFREWARHTGKYKEGDNPDPSTWKTRFRCALNKLPDIEEVKERSYLDGDEPYRVFKFLPKGTTRTEGTEVLSRSPYYEADVFDLPAGSQPLKSEDGSLDQFSVDIDSMISGQDFDAIQDMLMDKLEPNANDIENETDIINGDPSGCFSTFKATEQSMDPILDANINEIIGMNPEAVELEVKIYYMGKQVAQKIVNNQLGCRLHSGADFTWFVGNSELLGPLGADQIQFPDENSPPAIMENLSRGLLLQWEKNSIVVTRFCQAHVYASGGCLDNHVRRLERKQRTRVFDYDRFLAGLADYRFNRAPVPSYEVFFAFGQQPASGTTVDPGVCVTVAVTHLTAKASISIMGSAYDVQTSIEDREDLLVKNFQQYLKLEQAAVAASAAPQQVQFYNQ